MRKLFILFVLCGFMTAFVACDSKNASSEEQVEETMEDAEEATEEAMEDTEEAMEDAAEGAEETMEEMEEEVDSVATAE